MLLINRAFLMFFSGLIIATFVGCATRDVGSVPGTSTSDSSSDHLRPHLVAKKVTVRDHFGKVVAQESFKTPPTRSEILREAKKLREAATIEGNSSDTNDTCFEGAGVDPTTCGIQNGTVTITWTLVPQPPNGTIVSYSDSGIPAAVIDQDVFQPSSQASQPYTTTQQLIIDANAPVASDYVVHFSASCSNGVECAGQEQGLSILCSITQEHCPELQIDDQTLGYPVAAPSPEGTPLTVVGQQQDLSTSILPDTGSGSYSLSDYAWTIEGATDNPPSVIASYTFADSGATKTLLSEANLTSPSLSYYWLIGSGPLGLLNNPPSEPVNGMNVNVASSSVVSSAIAMRSDQQEQALLTANATYDVDAPDVSSITSIAANETSYGHYMTGTPSVQSGGSVSVNPGFVDALSLGTMLALPASAGIETNLTGVMPNSIGGSVAMTQLIHYSRTVTPNPGETPNPQSTSSGQAYVADGCALYTTNATGTNGATRNLVESAGEPIAFTTVDSPAEFPVATDDASLAVAQNFEDYYMFRPSGPNTIWVSIAKTTWSWSGQVNLGTNGAYSLTYSTSPSNPIYGIDDTELPIWSGQKPSSGPCHSVSGS